MNRVHATALLAGLAIGLFASLADDLLGAAAAVTVLQLLLWVVSAALLLRAATGLLRERGAFARRSASRPGRAHPA